MPAINMIFVIAVGLSLSFLSLAFARTRLNGLWFVAAPVWLTLIALILPLMALPGILSGSPLATSVVGEVASHDAVWATYWITATFVGCFTLGWYWTIRGVQPSWIPQRPGRFALTATLTAEVLLLVTFFTTLFSQGLSVGGVFGLLSASYATEYAANVGFVYAMLPLMFSILPVAALVIALACGVRQQVWIAALNAGVVGFLSLATGSRTYFLFMVLACMVATFLFANRLDTKRIRVLVLVWITLLAFIIAPMMVFVGHARAVGVTIASETTVKTIVALLPLSRDKSDRASLQQSDGLSDSLSVPETNGLSDSSATQEADESLTLDSPIANLGASGQYRSLEEVIVIFDVTPMTVALVSEIMQTGVRPAISIQDALRAVVPRFVNPTKSRAQFLQLIDSIAGREKGAAVNTAGELFANAGLALGSLVSLVFGVGIGLLQKIALSRGGVASMLFLSLLGPALILNFTRGYLFQNSVLWVVIGAAVWFIYSITRDRDIHRHAC